MKGLLIKDFYTLLKQMKIYIVIILVWALIPNFSASLFGIVYAAILPATAMAYDERSKWSSLAAMMPYSVKDLVLSKYYLGYIFTTFAAVFCFGAKCLLSLLNFTNEADSVVSIPVILCIALAMEAINLPFMFKLGVEKGRFILIIVTIAIVSIGTFFSALVDETKLPGSFSSAWIYLGSALIAIIINIVSIFISIKIYENKSI